MELLDLRARVEALEAENQQAGSIPATSGLADARPAATSSMGGHPFVNTSGTRAGSATIRPAAHQQQTGIGLIGQLALDLAADGVADNLPRPGPSQSGTVDGIQVGIASAQQRYSNSFGRFDYSLCRRNVHDPMHRSVQQ